MPGCSSAPRSLTDEQMAELEQQLDEIKGKVPADIQDDMDVISQGMADADGIVGLGEFLDSDEFKEAMPTFSSTSRTRAVATAVAPELTRAGRTEPTSSLGPPFGGGPTRVRCGPTLTRPAP